MKALLLPMLVLGAAANACGGDPRVYWPDNYERDITKWQEITPLPNPPESRPIDSKPPFWDLQWHVYSAGGKLVCDASPDAVENHEPVPPFDPVWQGHADSSEDWVSVPVAGGWIVAFDVGEFGAGVVWFNGDGSQQYEISQDYVQTFLATPDGLFAAGGLTHMGFNSGALYRLAQASDKKWRIETLADMGSPAVALAWTGDRTLLIAREHSLYSYSLGGGLHPLPTRVLPQGQTIRVAEPKLYCGGRYVFTENKLFLAARWLITEVDLHTLHCRYLVPDGRFTNDELRSFVSLSAKEESRQ